METLKRRFRARRIESLRWHRFVAIAAISAIACLVVTLSASLKRDIRAASPAVTPEGGTYSGASILSFEKDDFQFD